MLESLDSIIATLAVVLGLSLTVQVIQQIFKQWLDLKSNYMRVQLLALFDSTQTKKDFKFAGLGRATSMTRDADPIASSVVTGIEAVVKSYGYKDLELLEHINVAEMKKLIGSIEWSKIPGAEEVANHIQHINADVETWFDMAKRAFQDLYERRMKVWSFFTSVVVIIVLNANIFAIYSEFSTNAPLRDAAISWAEKYMAAPRDSTKTVVAASDIETANSIRMKVDSIRQILRSEGFQVLGWKSDTFLSTSSKGWFSNWLGNVAGWLMMAFLVSLGAPFWYDVMKVILGIKNRMKPVAAANTQDNSRNEEQLSPETPAVG